MIARLRVVLQGKKTNLISAWAFCGALFMWMNGIGEIEQQAILASVAALGASLRAGMGKATAMFVMMGISGLWMAGCAGLARIDPVTGTSPAQDIVAGASDIGMAFGPAFGTVVPLTLAGVLSIIIALGKAKESE